MKKRPITVLATILVSVVLCVGILGIQAVSQDFEGQTLVWISEPGSHFDSFAPMVREWEQKTGAKVVNAFFTGWPDLYNKIVLDFETETGTYDIVAVASDWIASLPEHLLPMNDMFEEYNVPDDMFLPAVLRYFSIGDKVLGVPYVLGIDVMTYRMDVLNDLGLQVPATLDELLETSEKANLKIPGVYSWMGMGKPGVFPLWHYGWILRSMGGEIINEAGNPAFDTQVALDAATYYRELNKYADPASRNWDHFNVFEHYGNGEAIFAVMVSTIGDLIWMKPASSKVALQVATALVPGVELPDGSIQVGHHADGWSLAISKYSKKQEAAKDLIHYIGATPRGVRMHMINSGGWSAVSPYQIDQIGWRGLREAALGFLTLMKSRPQPLLPRYMEAAEIIGTELSLILAGARTPEEAMKETQERLIRAKITGTLASDR